MDEKDVDEYRKQKSPSCDGPADAWWDKMKARIKDRWDNAWIVKMYRGNRPIFIISAIGILVVCASVFVLFSASVSLIRDPDVEDKMVECETACAKLGADGFRLGGRLDFDVVRMVSVAGSQTQCACRVNDEVKIAPWNDGTWKEVE